jgi:transposase
MTTLVQELKKATPSIRIWHPPLTQRATKGAIRAEIARFTAKRDQIVVLLKETCLLHHMEPALAAQEAQTAYKHAQSTRASQPRKLDEHQRKRIANRYWEAKQNGTAYGIVKALAREYEVSSNTIQTAVNKYKPN